MKKNLIALAVLAVSGVASAQSSVTLYGIADIWIGSTKATLSSPGFSESVRQTKIDSGGVSSSRWGLKGSEDLGGGLKANFVLEQGFNLDNGSQASTGLAFSRQATVGLSSGFGEVLLGKAFTSYDDIRGTAENTFDANISATKLAWIGYNANPSNTIKYVSPSFSGFSGGLSYALGEDKGLSLNNNNKASNVMALNVQYANGPVFVGYAHQTEKSGPKTELGALAGANSLLVAAGQNALVPLDGSKVTYNLLTGSYDLGVAKVLASYNAVKATQPGTAGSAKANEYQVGVEVPLASNLALGAGYAQSKVKVDGTSALKSAGYSAALVYSLSKRTALYAALNQTKVNDSLGLGLEAKNSIYGLGVKHAF